MNWLPTKEIKRRAEKSPKEALNVSIEEWEGKCRCIERGEEARTGGGYCGLCQRHNPFCGGDGCRNCCIYLEDDDIDCCQEYADFCDNQTPENAQAMLNRLYQEKGKMLCKREVKKECKKEKPKELRHGDYGTGESKCGCPFLRLVVKGVNVDVYNEVGGKNPSGRNPDCDIWLGNIFDDLERNSKDLEEFEVKGTGKSIPSSFRVITEEEYPCISLKTNNKAGPWCWATFDEATKIAHTILQAVATAKRQEAKKDC